MSSQIGTAYVRIVPSAQGIQSSTSKLLNNQMGGVGKTAGASFGASVVGVAGKYIGAAAIGEVLLKSLKAGGELEQSIGGIETLFKNSSDIVLKNSENAWKTAGLSANEYMQQATSFSASLLQSLGGDTKKAARITDQAIIDMSDNANKMGTDIESIQNAYQGFAKQNYTMLDNLKLGFGGTKSEMLRLLDTAGEITGKKYSIDNLADVYEAIHVIQTDLDITGTTSKEAASTLEGSFNSMRSSAMNFLGYLSAGENIKKPMKALIESTSTFLFDNLVPALSKILVNLPDAAITLIESGVPKILKSLDKLIPQLFNSLSKAWTKVYSGLINWLNALGNDPKAASTGLKLIGNIIKGILVGAMGLGRAILTGQAGLWKAVGQLGIRMLAKGKEVGSNLIRGMISSISAKAKSVVNKVKSFFPIKLGKLFKGLKMPHFNLKTSTKSFGKLGSLKYPTGFNVKWFAKGGIFDSPTVAGIGEAGAEAVVPLKELWNKFDALTQAVSGGNGGGGVLNVVMTIDGQVIGQTSVDYINGQTVQFNASPLMI